MIDLFKEPEKESEPMIYAAVKTDYFGISVVNTFISGLTLSCISNCNQYDPLKENIDMIGNDFICHLPEDGLVKDKLYTIEERCTSTDWESGYCDETELFVKEYLP